VPLPSFGPDVDRQQTLALDSPGSYLCDTLTHVFAVDGRTIVRDKNIIECNIHLWGRW